MKKKSRKKKKPAKGMDAILVFGFVFIVAVSILMVSKSREIKKENTMETTSTKPSVVVAREPAVAGGFYPGDETTLANMVDGYLNQAEKKDLPSIRGLVAPHAGYIYSGPTAAHAYKQLSDKKIKTAIVVGPSHHTYLKGASIPDVTHYKTPLGLVPLSSKAKEILREDGITSNPAAHAREHSVEVQMPFLQRVLGDFEVVPVVVGEMDSEKLADILVKYVDEETVLVASSDLSHYHPYETANKLDKICTDAIPPLNLGAMSSCEACGKTPVLALMHVAKKKGWSGVLLDYTNSGDTAGDKQRVVGYASIAFYEKEGVTGEGKETLLKLARETVESHVREGKATEVDESTLPPELTNIQGCFVTLHKHGQLRGCIGDIFPKRPLYQCIIGNAVNAAANDYRFKPVKPAELSEIDVEVSVLSVPKKLEYENPEDLLKKLTPQKDGVVVEYQGRKSTYLPQVWEQLPNKQEFLTRLCTKQGSPPDCWTKGAKIETYRAQVFGEKE